MVELLQGFVLTRHWRDTPAGTEVAFWLATEQGPRQVRLPPQPSVAFVLAEQRGRVESLLAGETGAELRPLALRDFQQRPVLGLYCQQHRQLMNLEKRLRQAGVEVFEADIRPPERYLMERVRDEAHRFAITHHRKRRGKRSLRSALDDIPGVGPALKKALVKHFGSVAAIRSADAERLAEVKGIGPALAQRIVETLGVQ